MRKIAHELIKRAYVQKLKDALVREQLVKQAGIGTLFSKFLGRFSRAGTSKALHRFAQNTLGRTSGALTRSAGFRKNLRDFLQQLYPEKTLQTALNTPVGKSLYLGRLNDLLRQRQTRYLIRASKVHEKLWQDLAKTKNHYPFFSAGMPTEKFYKLWKKSWPKPRASAMLNNVEQQLAPYKVFKDKLSSWRTKPTWLYPMQAARSLVQSPVPGEDLLRLSNYLY